jgi:hypothetical protein
MKPHLLPLFCVIALSGAMLSLCSGCAWSIGGGKTETSSTAPTQPPTRGQELIDLKKAHDQAAISDEEYDLMRQRILQD